MASEQLSLSPDSLATQAIVLSDLLSSAIEPILEANGLNATTFDLLTTIHSSGPFATQTEIANRLGIKAPSLTESLRGLKHFVEQVESLSDSRAKHLRLTNQGKAALAASIKSFETISKTLTAGIDKADHKSAIEVLKKANRLLAEQIAR